MTGTICMREKWYLLKTKVRQEKRAMENLQRQNVVCFCPKVLVEKISRGKKSQVPEILFPGYLFVTFESSSSSMHCVNSTRGVQSFICFGGVPAEVPCSLIQELKEKTETPEGFRISNLPKRGARLRVISGPFTGINVIFCQSNGEKRAEVLLNMMHQEVKVSIEYANLTVAH